MTNALQQLQSVETYLNNNLLERREMIHAVLATVIAKQHVFMLGPPGTAKSLLAKLISQCFTDSNYFYYLITPTSKPSEIWGPPSLSALKNDKYHFNTEGYFPEAHFVTIDEMWKGVGATLHAFLNGMNERVFKNGTDLQKIPLRTLFAASNETPADEGLAALYDRFTCRLYVDNLKSDGNFIKLLNLKPAGPPPELKLDLLDEAYTEAMSVTLSDEFIENLVDVRQELQFDADMDDVYVSDRRWLDIVRFLKAYVWLAGRTEVEGDDIRAAYSCMWSEQHQIEKVRGLLINKCSADLKAASIAINDVRDIINTANDTKSSTELVKLMNMVEKSEAKLDELKSSEPCILKAKRALSVAFSALQERHEILTGVKRGKLQPIVFADDKDLGFGF